MFTCERCGSSNVLSAWHKQPGENRPARCRRCGAVHSINNGKLLGVISPRMLPLIPRGDQRVSPWQLPHTRPIEEGFYDCRFSDTEPHILRLWWNGRNFQVDWVDTRRVAMRTFLSWRGAWELEQ